MRTLLTVISSVYDTRNALGFYFFLSTCAISVEARVRAFLCTFWIIYDYIICHSVNKMIAYVGEI